MVIQVVKKFTSNAQRQRGFCRRKILHSHVQIQERKNYESTDIVVYSTQILLKLNSDNICPQKCLEFKSGLIKTKPKLVELPRASCGHVTYQMTFQYREGDQKPVVFGGFDLRTISQNSKPKILTTLKNQIHYNHYSAEKSEKNASINLTQHCPVLLRRCCQRTRMFGLYRDMHRSIHQD